MGEFLSYSILSGMLLLALYLAYRTFLARENQHSYNRGVLLSIYFVSFLALPMTATVINWLSKGNPNLLTVADAKVISVAPTNLSSSIWGTIAIWIFIAGMAVVSVKTVLTWMHLIKVICSGQKIRHNQCILVITENEKFAPFSWMNYVVISKNDYENNGSAIITHELKHVACHHCIDLFIAQAVCIINWFNPAAWLMRDELMLVHEYQADMAVIDSGHDPQDYQMILIKKAVGARFPSLANSLNHSKLKKRITMMYKEKSDARSKYKTLALVPTLALAIGITTAPAVRAAVSVIRYSEISISKNNENTQENKKLSYFIVSQMRSNANTTTVVIEGGNLGNALTVSGGTLITNGNTYQAKSLECQMTDGNAVITATFPYSGNYQNSSMTLTVNGNIMPFDLNYPITDKRKDM